MRFARLRIFMSDAPPVAFAPQMILCVPKFKNLFGGGELEKILYNKVRTICALLFGQTNCG